MGLITKIKTFELSDLVDRTISIRSFRSDHTELVAAMDIKTGDFFVLKEIRHAKIALDNKDIT